MALVLWLEERKMPKKGKEIFKQAEKKQAEIILPAMAFAELVYLSEVGKIDTNLAEARIALENTLTLQSSPCPLKQLKKHS